MAVLSASTSPGVPGEIGSPAGDAHVARQRGALVPAIDDEIVALGLAGDRLVDGGVEEIVAFGGAQRLAQIGRVVLAEAHIERAGAGDAHAIAGFAEIVGERGDEAEPPAGFANAHVARRSAGTVVDALQARSAH